MLKTARAWTPSPELPKPPAFPIIGGGGGGDFPCEEANRVTSPPGDYPCAPFLGMPQGQLCPAWPARASPLWHMKLQSCEPSSQTGWCELNIIPPIPVALLGAEFMSLPQHETEFETLTRCELFLPPRKASLCQR